jgi:uncharacterized protein involved in type VI secretion and phage assembly
MAAAIGVTFVVGLQLRRAVSEFSSRIRAAAERIQPPVDEFRQGTVVTRAEVEVLTESVGRLTASWQRRPRRSR